MDKTNCGFLLLTDVVLDSTVAELTKLAEGKSGTGTKLRDRAGEHRLYAPSSGEQRRISAKLDGHSSTLADWITQSIAVMVRLLQL